jgi:3-hydroxyisobutyrate dehydrogenase
MVSFRLIRLRLQDAGDLTEYCCTIRAIHRGNYCRSELGVWRKAVYCGPVGNGLLMKLSINLFLMVLIASLAEAVHFAERQGLDLQNLQEVLDAGPMASSLTRLKIAKMISRDFTVEAGILDAWNSTKLIAGAASDANISVGLLALSENLYGEAAVLNEGLADISAVLRAIEARTVALRSSLLK